jgi:hypothetical protein
MDNGLHINKGATDNYQPGEVYIPVYSEGELIGNVTLTDINQLSTYYLLLNSIIDDMKTKQILKQNGFPETYQDLETPKT